MADAVPQGAEKPAPDWERIEAAYRSGLLSLREIAAPFKVTEGAIRKRAKKEGWERDLGAKIKAKADALVRKEAVRSEVRSADAATERETIEANAQAIARVRLEHRGDIRRGRALVLALLTELEAETRDPGALDALGELMRKPDEHGTDRLNDLYRKIIALPSRVESAKKLSEALKNLIGLEREAWGLDSAAEAPQPDDVAAIGNMTLEEAQRVYQDFAG